MLVNSHFWLRNISLFKLEMFTEKKHQLFPWTNNTPSSEREHGFNRFDAEPNPPQGFLGRRLWGEVLSLSYTHGQSSTRDESRWINTYLFSYLLNFSLRFDSPMQLFFFLLSHCNSISIHGNLKRHEAKRTRWTWDWRRWWNCLCRQQV